MDPDWESNNRWGGVVLLPELKLINQWQQESRMVVLAWGCAKKSLSTRNV